MKEFTHTNFSEMLKKIAQKSAEEANKNLIIIIDRRTRTFFLITSWISEFFSFVKQVIKKFITEAVRQFESVQVNIVYTGKFVYGTIEVSQSSAK